MSEEVSQKPDLDKTQAQDKLYSDEKIDTSVYKCPNCGGEAVFDAKQQKMRCLYCDSLFDVQSNGVVSEKEINELLNEAKVWDGTEVYQCKSCGAKEIVSNKEVAHTCPFCGTNNIVKVDDLPGLKPQGVVPFKMPMERVSGIAFNWVKNKFYAPRDFKKSAKPENIKGIYNPVFTFDAETKSSYNGRLGKNYTTTSTINGKTVTTTHTRYFNVSGNQNMNFDDYIIQASSNIPTSTLVKISPFSTNNAPQYTQDYLRGFSASTYNKNGRACWNECEGLMQKDIKREILRKYDHDVVDYLNVKTAYLKQKYKYVLVPVYVGHYNYRNKLYNFYINGENGRITGKTPVSVWKVLTTVIAILLLVGGIVALSFFLGD